MKSWLQNNDIEMDSTYNEGKSVVSEKLIRAVKNKIYKYMTSISKNVNIDKLDDIINEYNNAYHSTIKMKPNPYIDFGQENTEEILNLLLGPM